ncbi:MAG TPA: phosphatidate cytidylyltransferase [Bryobacteraceae bacterium]|nr:phosphatidate cytidylyltransferase [Bryobacteraceae bacterium]
MKRVLTALVLVPVAVYSVLFAPWAIFLGVVLVFACTSFHEYAAITRSFAPLGYVAGLLILIVPPGDLGALIFLTTLAVMCLPVFSASPESAVSRSTSLAVGILYIFGAWKCGILLHDIGPHWLMFALVVNWVGDTGAYYVGRRYGRHRLAPAISPGKSWEGAYASVASSVLFGVIYLPLAIHGMSYLKAALLSIGANVAGQIGDLAESAIKRSAGVKDSGTMLPGHGGMLDRLDSSLFAMPVLYAMLRLTTK